MVSRGLDQKGYQISYLGMLGTQPQYPVGTVPNISRICPEHVPG